MVNYGIYQRKDIKFFESGLTNFLEINNFYLFKLILNYQHFLFSDSAIRSRNFDFMFLMY